MNKVVDFNDARVKVLRKELGDDVLDLYFSYKEAKDCAIEHICKVRIFKKFLNLSLVVNAFLFSAVVASLFY